MAAAVRDSTPSFVRMWTSGRWWSFPFLLRRRRGDPAYPAGPARFLDVARNDVHASPGARGIGGMCYGEHWRGGSPSGQPPCPRNGHRVVNSKNRRSLGSTMSWIHHRFCWSGRRDSNPRPSPWQGDALPLSHFRRSCSTGGILGFWGTLCQGFDRCGRRHIISAAQLWTPLNKGRGQIHDRRGNHSPG